VNQLQLRIFALSTILWVSIWFAIAGNPYLLTRLPINFSESIHYIRTAFPLMGIFWFILKFSGSRHGITWKLPANTAFWGYYGLLAMAAGLISPSPWLAFYWAVMYMLVFAVLKLFMMQHNTLESVMALNQLNWIVCTLIFIAMLFIARDVLFHGYGLQASGRGYERMVSGESAELISRSTGLARLSSIPAILALVMFLSSTPSKIKWAWLGVTLGCSVVVYLMQSRGATFSLLGTIVLITMFMSQKARLYGLAAVIVGVFVYLWGYVTDDFIYRIFEHVTRGQDVQQLEHLSGRTYIWHLAWENIVQSPFTGWGFQADRFLIQLEANHVHNTYLYALLSAGFIGAALFTIGLLMTWWYLAQLIMMRHKIEQKHWTVLVQCGALMAFFTMRGIPEVSGAMFGVDQLIMVPAMAYIGLLYRQMKADRMVYNNPV